MLKQELIMNRVTTRQQNWYDTKQEYKGETKQSDMKKLDTTNTKGKRKIEQPFDEKWENMKMMARL